ncbi:MAG: hypothetical protein E6L09_06000 [Verrucomicrobia bacterium]|nr:MAG: hypothetical protein E6L09_06000 [Verrucomicrobiota bacterium]
MNRPQVIFYTYLKDEPNTLEDYRYVQKWGRAVRAAHSVVKVLVVEQPWTEPGQGGADSAWGDLYGAVDIWCPLFSLHRQESAARRQALDETIWTSISGDTDAHFARRAAWLRRTDGRARSLNVASKAASSSFSNSLCATWNPGSTKSSLPLLGSRDDFSIRFRAFQLVDSLQERNVRDCATKGILSSSRNWD